MVSKLYRVVVPVSAWLLMAPAFGQDADARLEKGLQAIQATRMRVDLTYLSSDELEGRRSLEKGAERATEFIAAQFEKAGLKPAAGGSYFQQVPLVEYRMDRSKTQLTVRAAGKKQTYPHGPDFSGGFPENRSVRGGVVFAGYGITAPEFAYDDYAGLDVKGKIVLIFDHEPQENDPKSVFNGLGNSRHAGTRTKALQAYRHGAAAVLIAPEPNRKHLTNQERSARIPGSQRRSRFASQALSDSLWIPVFTVSDAVAATLLAATGKKAAELQEAIDRTLKPASCALSSTRAELRAVTSERRRGVTTNVIGMLEGSTPALNDEAILFTSHYDHLGKSEDGVYHGADDNGSGTVGVIELARAFAANGARPKRPALFISFGAEEQGLLGSYYYTAHPLWPLNKTRAVINLDMIGRDEAPSAQTEGLMEIAQDTSNEFNLIGTVYSPQYREAIEHENARVGLKINYKWERDAALNILFRCDHFPFLLHDIPSVWWFNGFQPDYHQVTDTVEKINFTKMEKIVRLAYRTGWALADAAKTPAFRASVKAEEKSLQAANQRR